MQRFQNSLQPKEWLKEVDSRCTWIMPVCTYLLENDHGAYLDDMIANSVSRNEEIRYRIIPAHPPINYPFFGMIPFGLRGNAGVSCDMIFDQTSTRLKNWSRELQKIQDLLDLRLEIRLRREEEFLKRKI